MTDVFESSEPTSEEKPAGVFDQLVGEGKKYKTAEDLAKSRLEADNFIEQLKAEKNGVLEDLQKYEKTAQDSKTLEDLIEVVKSAASSTKDGNQPEFSQEELVKLIDSTLTNREKAQTTGQNRKASNEALLNNFKGDAEEAKRFLSEKARDLNMDLDAIKEIAEQSPRAFKQLLGISDTQKTPEAGASSIHAYKNVNSEGKFSSGSSERNFAYYENMRKEMGSKYWSPKVQQELMKDAERLGAKFYSK